MSQRLTQAGVSLSNDYADQLAAQQLKASALVFGPDGNKLNSVTDLLRLDNENQPMNPSIMLFLPNEYIKEPVFIGGSSHMAGNVLYGQMLERLGLRDITERANVMFPVAVDLVSRPAKNKPRICIRPSSARQKNWPDIIDETLRLLKMLGVKDSDIQILDTDPPVVAHAIKTGQMGRFYALPDTLLGRQHFIQRESRIGLGRGEGNLLKHAKAYYGLNGQRHVLASDFQRFIEEVIVANPERERVVKALDSICTLATSKNKLDVFDLSFYKAGAGFTEKTVKDVANLIRDKPPGEKIDSGDINLLNGLHQSFTSVVPDGFRTYVASDEEGMEELFRTLASGYPEKIQIEGLKVEYLGRGRWLNGPQIKDGVVAFPHDTDVPFVVQCMCYALGEIYPDLEYIIPIKRSSSGSVREVNRDPNREVYMCVMKRKSSLAPTIMHFKRVSPKAEWEEAEAIVENTMRKVTAARQLGIDIREHQYLQVNDEESTGQGNGKPAVIESEPPKDQGDDSKKLRSKKGGPYRRKYYIIREYDLEAKPAECLGLDSFKDLNTVVDREALLGRQAGLNAVVGRSEHFTDGGEALIMSPSGTAKGVVLIETDGLFNDLKSPILDSLDVYATHLALTLLKSEVGGMIHGDLDKITDTFVKSFTSAVDYIRTSYGMDEERFKGLFPQHPQIEKLTVKALKRIEDLDMGEVDKKLRERTRRIYWDLKKMVTDIPPTSDPLAVAAVQETGGEFPKKDKEAVALSLDRLFVVHSDQIDESLRVLNSDKSFDTLTAGERVERIEILRLNHSARESGATLDELNRFIQELKAGHGLNAYAHFEDELPKKKEFQGLNLQARTAQMIDAVYANPALLAELKEKGYITA